MAIVRGGITVKANVQAVADAIENAGLASSFGTYVGHSPPEGPTQAVDCFTPDNADGYALQDRICDYLMANQRRYGVRYLIRRHHIWNIERADEGWRDQGVTGNRTADHYDHVHVTCYAVGDGPYDGGNGPTEPPATPCEERVFQLGDSDRCVHYIQRLLLKRGYVLTDDGDYGPRTQYVIMRFQRSNGLDPDGVVGPATWAALWKGQTL
jgi:hypothetical protein